MIMGIKDNVYFCINIYIFKTTKHKYQPKSVHKHSKPKMGDCSLSKMHLKTHSKTVFKIF